MNSSKILYLLIITLLSVCCGLNAQTRQISISATNASVKDVFVEIQKKSGYRILYNDEVVPDDLRVSVDAENEPVNNILDELLKNSELCAVFQNDLIIITKKQYLQAQQEIFGTVTDENNESVPYCNVVLFRAGDTTSIAYGAVTDYDGYYKFSQVQPDDYFLKISYIGYKMAKSEFNVSSENLAPIVRNFKLERDVTILQELVVEGERPPMKAEQGKLVYYIPTLLKSKSVTNAYDALKEIPGITEQQDILSLIGTSGMTILLNGQQSSMSYEQLMTTLRSIPSSRIENIEIMYSAPPQYNVRGAAVNIVLKELGGEDIPKWQGEIAPEFRQKTYSNGSARVNLLYSGTKTSVDLLYSANYGKNHSTEEMSAEHDFEGRLYDIRQSNKSTSTNLKHNPRIAVGHAFDDKNRIDIAYTSLFDSPDTHRTAKTVISDTEINTDAKMKDPSYLHNMKADFSSEIGLRAGIDYTYYKDDSDYRLTDTSESDPSENETIESVSLQQIDRLFAYINQTHSLKNNWGVNYGTSYSNTHSKNRSDALRNGSVYNSATFDNRQRESIWNVFAGFTKTFSPTLTLQASLAAESYKSIEKSNGAETVLWDDIAWFPTMNINYIPSANHILQFSLSSDKTYPAYWSLNPTVYHFNAYGIMYGNPHLKPMRNYEIGLTYVFKSKYVLRPFWNYVPDYYTQMPYQAKDKLQQVFTEQNFNYKKTAGFVAVVPFRVTYFLSSSVTANGMYWREKNDNFFDIPFDRKVFFGYFNLSNDIVLSSKPDIRMDISAYYTTPAIQGIYDLSHTSNLSAGITWTSANKLSKLVFRANDIFDTSVPVASVDYMGQKSSLDASRETRYISLSYIYRFGGFKEKKKEEIDTSRFGGL